MTDIEAFQAAILWADHDETNGTTVLVVGSKKAADETFRKAVLLRKGRANHPARAIEFPTGRLKVVTSKHDPTHLHGSGRFFVGETFLPVALAEVVALSNVRFPA